MNPNDKDGWRLSLEMEEAYEWRKWLKEIPFVSFPSGWRVQFIPPFAGAVARFRVSTAKIGDENAVSVYLDCYQRLGCYDGPYWEVLPDASGENGRCGMYDTASLVGLIDGGLKYVSRQIARQKRQSSKPQ